MSDDSFVLPVDGHAELRISTRSGGVEIEAEDRRDLLIKSDVPLRSDRIDVDKTGRVVIKSGRGGSGWLKIRCPTGTDVAVGTVSGKVALLGQIGAARINTVSGKIDVERAESLDARSIAGRIDVGHCSGSCRLQTKSGKATIGSAGDCHISTMSGQIQITEATGKVMAQTCSGSVELGTQGKGNVEVQTLSGSVKVAVPKDMRPDARLRSLSGEPRCDCEPGSDCQIYVQSLSGKIEVVPTL